MSDGELGDLINVKSVSIHSVYVAVALTTKTEYSRKPSAISRLWMLLLSVCVLPCKLELCEAVIVLAVVIAVVVALSRLPSSLAGAESNRLCCCVSRYQGTSLRSRYLVSTIYIAPRETDLKEIFRCSWPSSKVTDAG